MSRKIGATIQIFLVAILMTTFGCLPKKTIITSPKDGSLVSGDLVDLEVKFGNVESENDVLVLLNGQDITNTLTVTPDGVTGKLQPNVSLETDGLNVLSVTTGAAETTSRFRHYPNNGNTGLEPLYSSEAYLASLSQLFNKDDHERLIKLAEAKGYATKIVVPTLFKLNNATTLVAQLHDSNTLSNVGAYIISFNFGLSGRFSDRFSILVESTGGCDLLYTTPSGESRTINLCTDGEPQAVTASAIQALITTGISPALDLAGPCAGSIADHIKSIFEALIGKLRIGGPGGPGDPGRFVNFIDTLYKGYECLIEYLSGDSSSSGDPHIVTLDNLFYDNQLIGEFVFLREKTSEGLEIQTRQEEVFVSRCVTGNSAVAMRIDGTQIQYHAGGELLINGEQSTLNANDAVLFPNGLSVQLNQGLRVTDSRGNLIEISDKERYIDIRVNAKGVMTKKIEGLVGNFNGIVEDDFVLRSGKSISDATLFAENWRIASSESLFTYSTNESTETFTKEQSCVLTPSTQDRTNAQQIFREQCGTPPAEKEALVDAIALDLAAGMPINDILGWFGNICSNATMNNTVVPWLETGKYLRVDSKANIFGSGRSTPISGDGKTSGELPPHINLPPGNNRILTVLGAFGGVGPQGRIDGGPDGTNGGTNLNSLQGISGITHTHKRMFLAGVFLNDSVPREPAPATSNFSADFTQFAPLLRQTFFIGDGRRTNPEAVQTFVIPDGATRLFLGFADGNGFYGDPGWYDDNVGYLDVYIKVEQMN